MQILFESRGLSLFTGIGKYETYFNIDFWKLFHDMSNQSEISAWTKLRKFGRIWQKKLSYLC